MCGVTETDCSCTANISSQNSEHCKFEFNQVMNASRMTIPVDYYSTPHDQTEEYETSTCPKDEETIVIPEQFRHVFYSDDKSEVVFAGMANTSNTPEELGMLAVDCGASTTLTKSLHNMTDVKPKVVTIQLAMHGLTMKSTHIGIKTYYAYDRTGTIRPIKTKALYVKELQQNAEHR